MLGNKIVVSNSTITNPVYVRYVWIDGFVVNLFNNVGLPASTFTLER